MFYNKHGKNLSKENIISILIVIDNKLNGIAPQKTVFKLGNDYFSNIHDMIVVDKNLFAITSILGKGAFGEVYKGENVITGRQVAIKCQQYYHDVEKQVMITKNHGIGYKNNVLGPKKIGNYKYFILPLADMDMYKWAANTNWIKILNAFIDICIDLERLHKDKKIHMDLKPDNILIMKDKAFISDFGKAETIGKIVNVINDDFRKYPHLPPEYFIGKTPYQYYQISESFDSWSLGFIIKSNIKYFPMHLQSMFSIIAFKLTTINPFSRMTISEAKNEFLNIHKVYKNPWWKIY